jgi:hypothetical protein
MGIHKRLIFAVCTALVAASASATDSQQNIENRCGWFVNPTPANASLLDRDGEWIIGMQGGHQAEGDWPEFKHNQWVRQNGSYGYGCACLKVVVDKNTHEVVQIDSASVRSLDICRKDPALKESK